MIPASWWVMVREAFQSIFDRITEVSSLDRNDLPKGAALVKMLMTMNKQLVAEAKEVAPKAS